MSLSPKEALQRVLQELANGNFLAPDAGMDALTEEAQQWLRDRIDEHLHALEPFLDYGSSALGLPKPEFSLHLRCTRSMHDAAESAELFDARRASPEEIQGIPEGPSPPPRLPLAATAEWSMALRDAWKLLQIATQRSNPDAERAFETLHQELLQSMRKSNAMKALFTDKGAPQWPGLPPWSLVFFGHFFCLMSDAPELSNAPWEPLMRIWQRGCWPNPQSPDVFLVYVPLRDGATYVLDPVHHRTNIPTITLPSVYVLPSVSHPWNWKLEENTGISAPPALPLFAPPARPPLFPGPTPGGPLFPPELE